MLLWEYRENANNTKGLKVFQQFLAVMPNFRRQILHRNLAELFRRIFRGNYKFGGYGEFSAAWGLICLIEETPFKPSQKCPYHVIFDLELHFEHILHARSPADHSVRVWSRSSHFVVVEVICAKKVYTRTHGQKTDAARLYLAHSRGIS